MAKNEWEATLARRTQIAERTWELDFGLGGQRIEFAAGQYCRITLPALASHEKTSRKFSFVNAPHDDRRVVVATREGITAYKCLLCELSVGARAMVRKVKGSLVLPGKADRPHVFIAGGIGIAPFISMLRELEHRRALDAVTLLYFNRTRSTAAYLSELERMAADNSGLRLVAAMTQDSDWTGEQSRLDRELLRRAVPSFDAADFFVVGAPAMVSAATRTLRDAGVSPSRIHDEDFSGYDPIAEDRR